MNKILTTFTFLFFCFSVQGEGPSVILPSPQPFSVDQDSAKYCIWLLKQVGLIQQLEENGKTGITKVETVWSYFLDVDRSYPEGHQLRYDIYLNGSPLDWDNSYIEYGGEMLNMRLLFIYRNQHPANGLKYRN